MLEKILDKNITKLRREIKRRNTDEWLDAKSDSGIDDNAYFWFHCGEKEKYDGKLDALLDLKKQIKFAKSEVQE